MKKYIFITFLGLLLAGTASASFWSDFFQKEIPTEQDLSGSSSSFSPFMLNGTTIKPKVSTWSLDITNANITNLTINYVTSTNATTTGSVYITNDLTVGGDVTGANLNISDWDTAYGWGDHSVAGYYVTANDSYVFNTTDTMSGGLTMNSATTTDTLYISSLAVAAGTFLAVDGNGLVIATSTAGMTYPDAGIALSTGSAWDTSITNASANWNTAYGWGDHSTAGYFPLTTWYATTTHALISSLPSLATVGTLTAGNADAIITLGTSIDISTETNLTVGATGIELALDDIALTSGYIIPLSASTTNWNTFYDTPSNRITAGTNISWSVNTLNIDDVFVLTAGDTMTGGLTMTSATTSQSAYFTEYTTCNLDTNANGLLICGTDADTTYLGGTNLTLDGTTFNVDDAFLVNTAADTTAFGLTMGSATTSDTFRAEGKATFNGNVGIGTTAPGAILDVNGIIRNNNDLQLYRTGSDPAISTGSGRGLRIVTDSGGKTSSFNTAGKLSTPGGLRTDADLDVATGASIGATYYNVAPPTSGMIIEGNVGIGTTSPSMKLSVQGDALADSWNVYSDIYKGDALTQLKGIKAEKGKTGDWVSVDHNSLPEGILKNNLVEYNKEIPATKTTATTTEHISYILQTMSISGLAQMNTQAVIQLDERLTSVEMSKVVGGSDDQSEAIRKLEARITELENQMGIIEKLINWFRNIW